jgi:hypothetical protein
MPGGWNKQCGTCRRAYDVAAWRELRAVETLGVERVQQHLSVPAAWPVEVRRCECGSVLAARSPR